MALFTRAIDSGSPRIRTFAASATALAIAAAVGPCPDKTGLVIDRACRIACMLFSYASTLGSF